MERIAVVSDTHGVLPCLDAVLAEPDARSADLLVVTGDIAAGPQPTQVLDRLEALDDRVRLVRGNADRDLVTMARGGDPPDTHAPFARLVDRRWVVNSGSTGMPYGSVGVPWAILDTNGVQLRSTTIDLSSRPTGAPDSVPHARIPCSRR